MPDRDLFKAKLDEMGVHASESLGQHFLIEDSYINTLASHVVRGATVVEIGSGPGNLTEALASKAGHVVGIEIDKKFQPFLEEVQRQHKNVQIVYGDALKTNLSRFKPLLGEMQIVASLPFHITEPFLEQLTSLPIEGATLILGDEVTHEVQQTPDSLNFGKLSLLAQTFFDINIAASIPRQAFFPQPRTDANIVNFHTKSKKEISRSRSNAIFARLFRTARKNSPIINEIKQAVVDFGTGGTTLGKQEFHQKNRSTVRRELKAMLQTGDYTGNSQHSKRDGVVLSQSHALDLIGRMGLPEDLLRRPFSTLDNQDIRQLTTAVRAHFG